MNSKIIWGAIIFVSYFSILEKYYIRKDILMSTADKYLNDL